MNKLKISDSDKRLLLIFFAIVIVACSYFFIFNKGMSKAAKIEEQNTTDRAKVQQMEQMEAGLPKVKENIQTMQVMTQKASTYHAICLPRLPLLRKTKLRWIGKLMHSPMIIAIM